MLLPSSILRPLCFFLVTFYSLSCYATEKGKPFLPKSFTGVRVGTLGLQGEIGYKIHSTLLLRFQAGGFFHKRKTFNFDGVTYHDVEMSPQTYNFIADWYFLNQSGFKISIGGGYNRNHLVLNRDMTPLPQYSIGGATVPGSYIGIVRSQYHFRRFTPYVGVGYDTQKLGTTNFSLSIDIGAYLQGDCRATVKATGPIQNDAQGMEMLKDKAQKLIDDTGWIKTYPVVSLCLRYHF